MVATVTVAVPAMMLVVVRPMVAVMTAVMTVMTVMTVMCACRCTG